MTDEFEDFKRQWRHRIRMTRLHANMTQTEFARALNVSHRSVQDWEAGITMPSARNRYQIERLFGRIEDTRIVENNA